MVIATRVDFDKYPYLRRYAELIVEHAEMEDGLTFRFRGSSASRSWGSPVLSVPVIGVAKTAFSAAGHAVPVVRGWATPSRRTLPRPASPADVATDLVRRMSGPYHLPEALRCVDAHASGADPVQQMESEPP